jgi:hypothetical protein
MLKARSRFAGNTAVHPTDGVLLFSMGSRFRGNDGFRDNDYSQYTTTYRPSHTTSTKCQYHAAPSNAK